MCVVETFAEEVFISEHGIKSVRQKYLTKRGKARYRYVALQSCRHCKADFVPTRRGVHVYCSNSCRSLACKRRRNYPKPSVQPVQEAKTVEVIQTSGTANEKLSLVRTGENLAAATLVSIVQYNALVNLIKQESGLVRNEIRSSESRMVRWLREPLQAIVNKLIGSPKKHNGIDAKDFEEIGRSML